MSNPRDTVLDRILGIPDQAKKYRKGMRRAAQELEAQGLEHKALSVRTKGMVEDLTQAIDKALSQMTAVPEGLGKQVLDIILDGVIGIAENDALMEADMNGVEGSVPEEAVREVTGADTNTKQVALIDSLVQSQADIVKDMTTIAQAFKALEPLAGVPALMTAFEERLKALETQLKMRPRRAASENEETVVDEQDKSLTESVKAQQSRLDSFWNAHIQG